MIVSVTPSPALDCTWRVDRLVVGSSHRADEGSVRAGGKGVNVARVAHAEGARVVSVSTVGGDTGRAFAADLERAGVPHTLVPVSRATRRSVAIVDETDATVVNERGHAPTPDETAALVAAATDASPTVLVVSGSLAPGTPRGLVRDLLAACPRAVSIVDTSGAALVDAAEAGADVLAPNRAELVDATGIEDPRDACRALIDRGVRLVMCSFGAAGMLAMSSSGAGHIVTPPETLSGNPTGAGDAAVAAIAAELQAAVDPLALLDAPDPLLVRAVAWSAAAVLMPLAGDISPRHAEFAQRIRVTDHPEPELS